MAVLRSSGWLGFWLKSALLVAILAGTAACAPAPSISPSASGATATAATKTRSVAVVVGAFSDLPGYPVTAAQAEDTFEGTSGNAASVRSFFQATSRGRMTSAATVLGPWELGIEQCQAVPSNFSGLMAAATDAATAHGIDLASFDHVVVWTKVPCGLTADGLNSGGRYVHLRLDWSDWPAGWDTDKPAISAQMAAHELAHNLGLRHADGLDCRDGSGGQVTFDGTCAAVSRADGYSAMGAVGAPYRSLLDADRLRALGWLDASEWQTVASAGTYHLVPVYSTSPGVRLIRVPRPVPVVALGHPGAWTLEVRSTLTGAPWDHFGATADLPALASVTTGVTIRYSEDGLGAEGESYLVDASPNASAGRPADFWDAPLQVGGTFTDAIAGISVRVDSVSAGGATVTIGLTPATP